MWGGGQEHRSFHRPGQQGLQALAQWSKPALVAFSDQDPIFPYPKSGDLFAELIPGATAQVKIEGAAHFLQEDKPSEIVAAIDAAFS